MKKLIFLLIASIILVSCENNKVKDPGKKGSSGKTLEMLVVCDRDLYKGETKDKLNEIFRRPQKGFMTNEPIFDIVNIPPSSYESTEMFKVHRNVLIIDIRPDNPNKVYKNIDQYAAPQVVFELAVTDMKMLDSFLVKYSPQIIDEMYAAEHRRIIKAFWNDRGVELMQRIQKQFGFELTISQEFEIAKMTDNFAWIRKEAKDFGIGLFVQTMPFKSKNQFEKQSIIDAMDTALKSNVPGPSPNSYMATERRWEIESRQTKIADHYATEIRGMWYVVNDFMGGPFVSYGFVSPDNKQFIILTAYTYSPRNTSSTPYAKRDHLMQVESICHSVKFPAE